MSKFQPIIKWSGSKRSQSEEIVNHFPKKIETYFVCFTSYDETMPNVHIAFKKEQISNTLGEIISNKNIPTYKYVCRFLFLIFL